MNRSHVNATRQNGAALFAALIILLVITVMATSSISVTSLEQTMALNTQAENMAFQASESAINAAVDDDSLLQQAVNSSPGNWPVLNVDLNDPNISSSAEIRHMGTGNASGFSLGLESGMFGAYRFEIVGNGTVGSINIQSETTQGLYKIAPSG
jgi:type IV pilus assembly protein PilX|tara:strand:+ start:18494 stop:18955 length:462 start_codon:yes stop_codon:yes gene_type:complete